MPSACKLREDGAIGTDTTTHRFTERSEQKNGTLEETEDDLIVHYANQSKSVVRQVQRALDNVRDKFRRTQGGRTPGAKRATSATQSCER